KLKILALGVFTSALGCLPAAAQMSKQTSRNDTSYQPIIPVRKAQLLRDIDVIANMQYALNNDFSNGKHQASAFANNQFRLEIKGKVHEKVSFRFRDRYTRAANPASLDNLSRSTDLAFITVEASSRWNLSFGKMCADWGGYEFDDNPIDIFRFNDIVENADNFLTGAQASFKANKNHQFTFQVLNSRTQFFNELYGNVPNVVPAAFPAAWVINWRGKSNNQKWETLWSYSIFTEAKNTQMHYLALGTKFNPNKKWQLRYDFKLSDEDLDRKAIIQSINPSLQYAAFGARYREHWLDVDYYITPQWTISCIGMTNATFWNKNPDPNRNNLLRNTYTFVPSIEYYPYKNLNLRFFAAGIFRSEVYTQYAKNTMGAVNNSSSRISLGFITPLLIL
ncbi:MAG: hypothetical protein EAY68_02895, partial [Bacteroidetes bacterium]